MDGTATVSDHDYEPVSGTLTFLPGESTKTITAIVDSDDHVEPDEAFFNYADAFAVRSTSGRTSIEPVRAEGIRAAIALASSRLSASMRK